MATATIYPQSAVAMSKFHNPNLIDYSDPAIARSPAQSQPEAASNPTSVGKEQGPPQANPPTTAPGASVLQAQSAKKRRASKGKVPSEIRRSASSPHIRTLVPPESGSLSPTADKRRSKLGYHRTAVACGHCRRRKIRCLVSHGDPQNRCANCIRLKKECNFYPVEQSEAQGPQGTGGVKSDGSSNAPSASNTSSPKTAGGVVNDGTDKGLPSAASSTGFGIHPDLDNSSAVSLQSSAGIPSESYPYPESVDEQWQTTPGIFSPSSLQGEPETPNLYWKSSPSRSSSGFSRDPKTLPGQPQPVLGSTPSMGYPSPHDSQGWALPQQRSMSYGHIDQMPQSFLPSHMNPPSDYPGQAPPYGYPAPIDTRSTLGSTPGPMSAPVGSQSFSGYGYAQPVWHQPFTVPSSGQEMEQPAQVFSNQWFSEPGALHKVDEEQNAPQVGYVAMQEYFPQPGARPSPR